MNRRTFILSGLTLALTSPLLAQEIRIPFTGSKLRPDEAEQLLALHNVARSDVGVGPLNWSEKLAGHAQQWAEHLAATGKFEHSNSRYGENLAAAGDVAEAMLMWLSEKESWRKGMGFTMKTGHYTQIVWKKTRQVGCGKAESDGYTIWVASYDPPGNMNGKDPY